ncbi:hypothetical protein EB796_003611 [Bugula neritina]|uniref:DUF4190 domain-containing protein n=1 Tax=Bugula neritina TaxID=10212 RepID=A0A7J7KHC8_BUGNE|nr:hypothetical protein EB796_003611 [Bugula neritina]
MHSPYPVMPSYTATTRICPSYTTTTWICPSYTATTRICPSYAASAWICPTSIFAQPPANGYVTGQQVKDTSSTCWLVVGILTAILCCLPLGVAGAVMAYLSGEDARRGNAAAYKTKICQSKALTLTGLGIGLLAIIAIVCAIFVKSGSTFSGTQSSDAIYLGCFEDNILRDLDGDDYDFGDNLSVENCNTYCYDRGG